MLTRQMEPIAVIAMACRFPGGANTPEKLWQLLCRGEVAISDIPSNRWNADKFHHDQLSGRINARQAGFLQEDVFSFDPTFFQISPREAEEIDPQQRLTLEATQEALENAGWQPQHLRGEPGGVFLGSFSTDAQCLRMSPLNRTHTSINTATSSSMTILSARVAYFYDWTGPCFTLDTACSSSLVAIHNACQSLRNGECSFAIAGGANIMLIPEVPAIMSKGGFLAADSRCRSFDDRGQGYVRGEGAGVILLKPLSAALKDDDPVEAVILGTGINQDGRTDGITVPNKRSQAQLMETVLHRSGITANDIVYFEAHGTGTPVGDPIEASAIGSVIGQKRTIEEPLPVGAIKSNIGHLEGAAGVAGVIKSILCLQHKQAPATPLFEQPNKNIDFKKLNIKVSKHPQSLLPKTSRSIAAVNSFGYGGSNAHIHLEAFPASKQSTERHSDNSPESPWPFLIPLSGGSKNVLSALSDRLFKLLSDHPETALEDLSGSLFHTRDHYDQRRCLIAKSPEELMELLASQPNTDTLLASECTGHNLGNGKVAFVFTGMGPQWPQMALDLIHKEPLFSATINQCQQALSKVTQWSIIEEISHEAPNSNIHQTEITQPCIFSIQAALFDLLANWGVKPDSVMGHSIGEVAANYAAGNITLEEGVLISYYRSKHQGKKKGMGTMLAVGCSEETLKPILTRLSGKVDIAAINGKESLTLSGDSHALERLESQLSTEQIYTRFLDVEIAYHSDQLQDLEEGVLESLSIIQPKQGEVPIVSTVTGEWIDEQKVDAHYWWQNIIRPVLFYKGLNTLISSGHRFFIEIGPHPVLANGINSALRDANIKGIDIPTLVKGQSGITALTKTLGNLYCAGAPLPPKITCKDSFRRIRLPNYPFDRAHYWSESDAAKQDRFGSDRHPMLLESVSAPCITYQSRLTKEFFPYLNDHKLEGIPVLPAAFYLSTALELNRVNVESDRCILSGFKFTAPCIITNDDTLLRVSLDDADNITLFSCPRDKDDWITNASGRVIREQLMPESKPKADINAIRRRCVLQQDAEEFYLSAKARGMNYGANFQCIKSLWHSNDSTETLALLECSLHNDKGLLHPALLDSAFQSLLGSVQALVMVMIAEAGEVYFYSRPPTSVYAHVRLKEKNNNAYRGDITLLDDQGEVYVEIIGIAAHKTQSNRSILSSEDIMESLVYQYHWATHSKTSYQKQDSDHWAIISDDNPLSTELAEYYGKHHQSSPCPIYWTSSPDSNHRLATLLSDYRSKATSLCLIFTLGADSKAKNHYSDALDLIRELYPLVRTLSAHESSVDLRLFLLTENAQPSNSANYKSLRLAPVLGIFRTMVNECLRVQVRLIDIPSFATVSLDDLFNEICCGHLANEESILQPDGSLLTKTISQNHWQALLPEEKSGSCSDANNFLMEFHTPGLIDSLYTHTIPRHSVKADLIEVETHTVSLNFKDLMKLMGMLDAKALEEAYTSEGLGMELSGTVTRTGPDVTDFKSGDEVCLVVPGAFRKYAYSTSHFMFPKLPGCTMAETPIFVPFMTVIYALKHIAQLSDKDSIFIPSATGAVGLAAIQYARSVGARIIAGAGTREKRKYLQDMGLELITNSRSVQFSRDILKYTNGNGVDVILNSMPGNLMLKAWEVLAPYGRFMEIGKQDITENSGLPMSKFNYNATFSAVDLDHAWKHNQALIKQLIKETWAGFDLGIFTSLPTKCFAHHESTSAFKYMARGEHIGKIHINLRNTQVSMETNPLDSHPLFSENALYIVTGAFGGIGMGISQWLADNGAGHILMLGRRAPDSFRLQQAIDRLKAAGAGIYTEVVDVSNYQNLQTVISNVIQMCRANLKGIFHCAAQLNDGLISQLQMTEFLQAFPAKMQGAWNLHQLSCEKNWDLDHFVMMSSASAMIGNPGQANYVAANTFLEHLAQLRQQHNKPGLAINLGAVSDAGMLARDQKTLIHLQSIGLQPYSIPEVLALLTLSIKSGKAVTGIMNVDWEKWASAIPRARHSSLFKAVVAKKKKNRLLRFKEISEFVTVPHDQQQAWITDRIKNILSSVIKLSPEDIAPEVSLKTFGFDSLMAVELQQLIKRDYGITYPAVEAMKGPSVLDVADYLLNQIREELSRDNETSGEWSEQDINNLSEEELDKLLTKQLLTEGVSDESK